MFPNISIKPSFLNICLKLSILPKGFIALYVQVSAKCTNND